MNLNYTFKDYPIYIFIIVLDDLEIGVVIGLKGDRFERYSSLMGDPKIKVIVYIDRVKIILLKILKYKRFYFYFQILRSILV